MHAAEVALRENNRRIPSVHLITGRKIALQEPNSRKLKFSYSDSNDPKELVTKNALGWFPDLLTILPNYTVDVIRLTSLENIKNMASMYTIITSIFTRSQRSQKIKVIRDILENINSRAITYEILDVGFMNYFDFSRNPITFVTKKINCQRNIIKPDDVVESCYVSLGTNLMLAFEKIRILEEKIRYIITRYQTIILSDCSSIKYYVSHAEDNFESAIQYTRSIGSAVGAIQLSIRTLYRSYCSDSLPRDAILNFGLMMFTSRINRCLDDDVNISNLMIEIGPETSYLSKIDVLTPIMSLRHTHSKRVLRFFLVKMILEKILVEYRSASRVELNVCFIGEVEKIYHFFEELHDRAVLDVFMRSLIPKSFKVYNYRRNLYLILQINGANIELMELSEH